MPVIIVDRLVKEYKRNVKKQEGQGMPPEPGAGAFADGPPTPKWEKGIFKAVDDISFSIDKGEMVGYIGPNGAGKSTTIKMLTGILVPTSGRIEINGIVPYKQRKKNAKNIGVVFGQRSQLWWDLPVMDSFKLLKYIYDIPAPLYNENIEIFKEVLGLGDFFHTPVRQLSLGQRMRADIGAALLHNPDVLFLDEPTIGLDTIAKESVREFIRQANRERNITVILTTHDMSDIEQLCKRIMIIDKGKLIYEGSIEKIREEYGKERVLVVDFDNESVALPPGTTLVGEDGRRKWIHFQRDETNASRIITALSQNNDIMDLSIKEESIEAIIQKLYLDSSARVGG